MGDFKIRLDRYCPVCGANKPVENHETWCPQSAPSEFQAWVDEEADTNDYHAPERPIEDWGLRDACLRGPALETTAYPGGAFYDPCGVNQFFAASEGIHASVTDPSYVVGHPPAVTPVKYGSTSLEEVLAFRREMFDKSIELVAKKGADYNRDQQQSGDSIFNMRVCEILGIVPSAEEGILVRLSDKFMRLISLVKPGREAAVKDESVLDTIRDIHNYVDYMGLLWLQRRGR